MNAENKIPFVQVIYTLMTGRQIFANIKLVDGMFDSKEHFINLLVWAYDSSNCFYADFEEACEPNPPFRDSSEVQKMSCCVYLAGQDVITPYWYHECNGKFKVKSAEM